MGPGARTVVDLELPAAGPGLGVGLQLILQKTFSQTWRGGQQPMVPVYPVHGDGVELPEGQVPGRFGAVPPPGLHEAEQSLSGLVLGHFGNSGRTDAGCWFHLFEVILL